MTLNCLSWCLGLMLHTSSRRPGSKWCRTWHGLCMMRWKSASSIDSASCVRLFVSGEHRPLRMPCHKNAISCGGQTPPSTYCIQEFANDNGIHLFNIWTFLRSRFNKTIPRLIMRTKRLHWCRLRRRTSSVHRHSTGHQTARISIRLITLSGAFCKSECRPTVARSVMSTIWNNDWLTNGAALMLWSATAYHSQSSRLVA